MKTHYFKMRLLGTAVLLAGVLTGCSSSADEPKTPAEPIALSRAEAEVLETQSDFALSFLKSVSAKNPGVNVGFSPVCLQQALSMLGNGVADPDRAAYAQALGLPDVADLNALNVRLNESLPMRDPEHVSVSIANGLWLNQVFSFNPGFVGIMRDSYKSESDSYDFGAVNIADIANKWIAGKTRNGIRNLLPSSYNRNREVIFILANALHFNGKWNTPFEVSETKPCTFTDSYGQNGKEVTTMHGSQSIGYIGYENYSMSSLSFGQGMYRMLVILPDEGTTPDEVLSGLSASRLKDGLSKMRTVKSEIYLPKFEMTAQGEVVESIEEAGLPLNKFSYAGLCENVDVITAFHGFSIRIDEKGAEIKASAAMSGMCSAVFDTPGPELRINRPFIFAVYEGSSDAILGMGIINDPGDN